ncbi:Retrovirus-related Pol polyprotein from transposon RE2 [Bienertia sinuspersici]
MSATPQPIDPSSPLYLHPSDGPGSVVVDKLEGSHNYRAWRRDMELSLGAKRKLGFVTGAVTKDETDPVKKSQWDTCNDMIITWICRSVSDSIKRGIMFMGNSHDIWKYLEETYAVTDGWRKYSLSRQVYESRQNGRPVAEFYTEMRVLWEETEAMQVMPPLTEMNSELSVFVHTLYKQREEQKLFQFLGGLDEIYSMQRSSMLHQVILPSAEQAFAMIRREESQRKVFNQGKDEMNGLAMNVKKGMVTCSNCNKPGHVREQCWACKICGKKRHQMEQCWYIKGFPSKFDRGKKKEGSEGAMDEGSRNNSKWNKGKAPIRKVAANAKMEESSGGSVGVTAEQLERLIKLLPTLTRLEDNDDKEDLDVTYAGMVSCNLVNAAANAWIVDSGATHHMSGCKADFAKLKLGGMRSGINLPNGNTAEIQGVGEVQLKNNLVLTNVLYIPSFKHKLLSIQKLSKESECRVDFYPSYCLVIEEKSQQVLGVGQQEKGLYYMQDEPVKVTLHKLEQAVQRSEDQGKKGGFKKAMTVSLSVPSRIEGIQKLKKSTLWHYRLGHISESRLKLIPELQNHKCDEGDVCIICPMAKQTRLSYSLSDSRASKVFELIHLDI